MTTDPLAATETSRRLAAGGLCVVLAVALVAVGLRSHQAPPLAGLPLLADRRGEPVRTQSRWLGWSALSYETPSDPAAVSTWYRTNLSAAGWRQRGLRGDWERGAEVLVLQLAAVTGGTRVSALARWR